MINLTTAISMVQSERDAAATVAQRKALNTAANMLRRAQSGKPVFKSQLRYVPQWCIEQAIEFDIEMAVIQASVALED